MSSTGLRIELLGGFRVSVGDKPVPDDVWHRRRPAGLLKLLALAPGHRLHREQVMDVFWPELDPAAAGANLRKAIHHARNALEDVVSGTGRADPLRRRSADVGPAGVVARCGAVPVISCRRTSGSRRRRVLAGARFVPR